jgi:hypothetical protein
MNPDSFADGIPVTMEKVGENDQFLPSYEMRVRSRTRMPDWVMGDARGRLAGMITIRDRVIALSDKYGLDYFKDVMQEYVEDSRRYATARVKTQGVPGRIRKSNFKDLAMLGKRVIMPQQNVDLCSTCRWRSTSRPRRSEVSLRRQRLGSLGRTSPRRHHSASPQRLLPHRRLRHVQLGRRSRLGARPRRDRGQPYPGTTSRLRRRLAPRDVDELAL